MQHLLALRAWIPDHHGLPSFARAPRGHVSARWMVEFAQDFPLDFVPGTPDRAAAARCAGRLDPLESSRFRHRLDEAELTFEEGEGPAREVEWLERGTCVPCPRQAGG